MAGNDWLAGLRPPLDQSTRAQLSRQQQSYQEWLAQFNGQFRPGAFSWGWVLAGQGAAASSLGSETPGFWSRRHFSVQLSLSIVFHVLLSLIPSKPSTQAVS